MGYIIIGLGNPGKKYENTRHNVGFFLLDKIINAGEFSSFEINNKFNAEISKGESEGREIILFKPQTFMNNSGLAVKNYLEFFKLTPNDILVIHDDIDIAIGKYKIATDSTSAGHNGIQNIIDTLGTQKFKRIRIGIGKTPEEKMVCPISAHDFVLEKFPKEELDKLEELSKVVLGEIKKFIT